MMFSIEALVARPVAGGVTIDKLDPRSLADRHAALATIHDLFRRFVVPAADLLVTSDDDANHLYFDPERAAGSQSQVCCSNCWQFAHDAAFDPHPERFVNGKERAATHARRDQPTIPSADTLSSSTGAPRRQR